MTEECVLNFQPALQHGLCDRASGIQVDSHHPARGNFGVQQLQECHVDRAIQSDINFLRACQMSLAVGCKISSASCQVNIFEQKRLVCYLEPDGADILYLHVPHFDAERLKLGGGSQSAWMTQRAANVEGAFERGMTRDFSRKVNAE